MENYSGRLIPDESAKDIDYIVLNFSIANEEPFLTNLAVMYIDQPGEWTFRFAFLKALDRGGTRYYRRQDIAEAVSLKTLESNIREYVDAALGLYDQWDKDFVTTGEQVMLAADN